MFYFISALRQYHELIYYLTLREVKGRYKQSLLGYSWAIFQPVSLMIIFTVIFSRVARIGSEGLPYPIFVYCALLPWQFFSSSLNYASNSLTTHSAIIRKIYFPRFVFPLASVLACLLDFCTASVVFVALLFIYKIKITYYALWIIPIFLLQLVFIIALSLIFSSINVFYRDVKNAMLVILQLWMYCTPVIYPSSIIPDRIKNLFLLNPMAGIIDGYRRILLHGRHPDFYSLGAACIIIAAVFFISYRIFKRLEGIFADVI